MSPIAGEVERLTKRLSLVMQFRPELASEVPMQIHTRDTDDGHGLGGPAFHPAFLAWLSDSGACTCERKTELGEVIHYCSARPREFRKSEARQHPRRLKRALRKLREVNPVEFDIVYLILARGHSYQGAMDRINTGRLSTGQDLLSPQEFAILTIAGMDKTCEMF